jgi:hypothetical protein
MGQYKTIFNSEVNNTKQELYISKKNTQELLNLNKLVFDVAELLATDYLLIDKDFQIIKSNKSIAKDLVKITKRSSILTAFNWEKDIISNIFLNENFNHKEFLYFKLKTKTAFTYYECKVMLYDCNSFFIFPKQISNFKYNIINELKIDDITDINYTDDFIILNESVQKTLDDCKKFKGIQLQRKKSNN